MKICVKIFISVIINLLAHLAFSQDIYIQSPSAEKNKKEISIYLEHPIFFDHWGELLLADFELLFIKKHRDFNPGFNIGYGLEFTKAGIATHAIPIEFKFVSKKSKIQIEKGFGLIIVDPDVFINARIGIRTYLFNNILVRLNYTPYFMVPYGDREEGKAKFDIKSDLSVSFGYRF